jgi:hypothetical protein
MTRKYEPVYEGTLTGWYFEHRTNVLLEKAVLGDDLTLWLLVGGETDALGLSSAHISPSEKGHGDCGNPTGSTGRKLVKTE